LLQASSIPSTKTHKTTGFEINFNGYMKISVIAYLTIVENHEECCEKPWKLRQHPTTNSTKFIEK
jgi:hypothetical protein